MLLLLLLFQFLIVEIEVSDFTLCFFTNKDIINVLLFPGLAASHKSDKLMFSVLFSSKHFLLETWFIYVCYLVFSIIWIYFLDVFQLSMATLWSLNPFCMPWIPLKLLEKKKSIIVQSLSKFSGSAWIECILLSGMLNKFFLI